MYQVNAKPQFVFEKMKDLRPKTVIKKYLVAAGSPPPPPGGGGNGDPFKNIIKKNIPDDVAKKISEAFGNKKTSDKMFNNYKINKETVKFNDFTEFLKKDSIPQDITEKLNKFIASVKKPQNIFNTFKKLK